MSHTVIIDGVEYVPALKLREPDGTLGGVLRGCRKAMHMTLVGGKRYRLLLDE